jgi:hypothetical protein
MRAHGIRHSATVLLFLGVAAAPAVAADPATASGTPRLVVENFTVDVGNVQRGKDAEAVFHLKNTGNATLKILSAKPT